MSTLEERIGRLEDIEEIKQLKAEYCASCDDNHNGPRIAALFVEDGVWHRQDEGPNNGREEIAAYMNVIRNSGRMRNSAHMVTNPQIEVTGDTAVAKWRFTMMYTAILPNDGLQYHRIIGYYIDDHVKKDGKWYFQVLRPFVEEVDAYPTEADALAAAAV